MDIVIMCVISVLISLSIGYVIYNKELKDKEKIVLFSKRSMFILFSLVSLCVISVLFSCIYNENHLVMNVKLLFLLGLLFVATYFDYTKMIIPNKLIIFGLISRVFFYIAEIIVYKSGVFAIIKQNLIACAVVLVMFIIGVVLVKNGIGMGDIKLVFVMCLYQGFTGIISSLFMSLIIAFVFSLIMLIIGRKSKKDTIPFAPAILVGTLISVGLTGM